MYDFPCPAGPGRAFEREAYKMNVVKVRNTVIGEGMPKICVPIVGVTREAILDEARAITELPADVVEWRVDWYENAFDFAEVKETLKQLREVLGELPLLMTFRTSKEGGEKAIEADAYAELNIKAAETGFVDLVDVEVFTGDEVVKRIIKGAHDAGVRVVGSNHDFDKTPDKDDIVGRLRKMQDLGADIPKIAVMPNSRKDVLTLLEATEEMSTNYADRPIITMSMAGTGVVSRLTGETFGSALTFGAAAKASAPGQMGVNDLKTVLTLIHGAM
jgi:3-dehydroquinate dehydratase-1